MLSQPGACPVGVALLVAPAHAVAAAAAASSGSLPVAVEG